MPHKEQIYARPERNLLSKRYNSFPADVSMRPMKFKLRHYPKKEGVKLCYDILPVVVAAITASGLMG